MSDPRCVIVGLGNRFRGDDGAGLALAERLRGAVPEGTGVVAIAGDPTPLLDILAGAELVLVADAVMTNAVVTDDQPGTVYRFDASDRPIPGAVFGASTHAFGLGETIELARALNRLNARVLVYGIAAKDFSATEQLSPAVVAAVELVAEQMLADLSLPGRGPAPSTKEQSHA